MTLRQGRIALLLALRRRSLPRECIAYLLEGE